MSAAATIDIRDSVSPALRRLGAGLTDLAPLNAKIAVDELALVRRHLTNISLTRHATAQKLGATPSGFYGRAAEGAKSASDATGATVSVFNPGIGRAFHDVTIVPGPGKKFLTIPLIAEAYNQRAYRLPGLFFTQPKGKPFALLGRKTGDGKDAKPQWVYLLVTSVHQKQDRTLLPPDDAFLAVAQNAAIEYVDQCLADRAIERGTN